MQPDSSLIIAHELDSPSLQANLLSTPERVTDGFDAENLPQKPKSLIPRPLLAFWYRVSTVNGRVRHNIATWFADRPLVRWLEFNLPGWQTGVVVGIFLSVFVLVFNIIFLVLATRRSWGADGLGILLEGECSTIDRLNKIGHGVINVMSTLLLMTSNYCMQLLAAPTRSDVDVAHRKHDWVDIGMQSIRNVWKRHISPWRCLCWVVLAMSSLPLHLLWNSVIIFSPAAFQYNQLTVDDAFVHGVKIVNTTVTTVEGADYPGMLWPDNLYDLQNSLNRTDIWTNLTNSECKRAYAQSFVRDRSDVVVVTKTRQVGNIMGEILGATSGGWGPWPYQWLCPTDAVQNFKCYDQIRRSGDEWKFPRYDEPDVLYCLSKKAEPVCKLEYGMWIAVLTVVANFVKVVCFITTFIIIRSHTNDKDDTRGPDRHANKLLITTGDAISSFLERPDPETVGMSLVERKDFVNGIWTLRWVTIQPMIWRHRSNCSWFRAVGLQEWLLGMLPLAFLFLVPSIFLLSKMNWLMYDVGLNRAAINQLGIGNPNGLFLLGSKTNYDEYVGGRLLGKVALANLPQLAVSIAYFLWNNYLTSMVAAREYDKYAAPARSMDGDLGYSGKRSLRVTHRTKGSDQQSTRFLTVPWRYWFINVVLWTLLHYLASQAVFFARVDVLDHWLEVTQWSISQVGYSVLGLLYFFGCAFLVFLYAFAIGLKRIPNRMPLGATCSAALSAACHPADNRLRHYERKVQWGVEVTEDNWVGGLKIDNEKLSVHCTFTSGEAFYPEAGRWYT